MSEHRLGEIVIERPRGGMRISCRKMTGFKKQLNKLTQEAEEDGLLSPYLIKPTYKTKWLSDHLGPLRRFLRSHVGQPWNEVYSQICQQIDTSTMLGKHLLSHLWSDVELHVELIEGVLYGKSRWGGSRYVLGCYRDQLYVHPETGILCLIRPLDHKTQERESRQDILILDVDRHYRKIDEIWYLITFADFPPPPTQYVRDVLDGMICRSQAKTKAGRRIYAVGKRQCGKKEIRFISDQLSQSRSRR